MKNAPTARSGRGAGGSAGQARHDHTTTPPIDNLLGRVDGARQQGTGKTTAQKKLVLVIDPGPVPTRKPPRDADSWVTAAAGSLVVGIDNLSEIPHWLSDSFCRASTGDGDVRRRLYTDGEHAVFAFRRCIILNGIDLGATRGDLGERMLPIRLQVIPEAQRLTEGEIWNTWDRDHPRILGALLDLAAGVAGVLPCVHLESTPRMADFARVVAAVDRIQGTDGLRRYREMQGAMAADSLTGDPFVARLLESVAEGFQGTSAALLQELTPERPPKGWPANARAVTQSLRRNAPALRRAGWVVEDDDGRNRHKAVVWTLLPPGRPEITRNPPPHDPHTRASPMLAGLRVSRATNTGHLRTTAAAGVPERAAPGVNP